MNENITTIDQDLCIGCGKCVDVCPNDIISLVDDKATITGEDSLGCDHCAAACPVDAITINFTDGDALDYETFESDTSWLKFGDYDTKSLVNLMASRRSCRNFDTDQPVSMEVLEDLVKIGTTAPSGTNSQMWTFTIVPDRDAVLSLALPMLKFFKKLNDMADKSYYRLISKWFMDDQLGIYHREYRDTVEEAIHQFQEEGRDRLFHGAPALIMIGSKKGATCPVEDAMLAAQNILLAAHAMGYGTCLIGFAVEAIKNDAGVRSALELPPNERIHAVIAIGKSKEEYERVTGRKKIIPKIHRAK